MTQYRLHLVVVASLLAAAPLPSPGDEPLVAPVRLEASPDILANRSPYDEAPEYQPHSLPDTSAHHSELHPNQAAWINAAYFDEPFRIDDHCRAGRPEWIRPRAIPSNSDCYCGYYVGGGAALFGHGRYLDEGTWGWDYFGITRRKRAALNWWHGKVQGGTGQYQTDGPKVLHHE
jgi:hypothetical protein